MGRVHFPPQQGLGANVPVYANLDEREHDSNVYFVVNKCNPGLTDLFMTMALHEHLLSLPLKAADVKAEALHEACGIRTDYQFITRQKMRGIQKRSKGRE
nr:hypothetical protein [uncultured Acetatifactor sp.]